MIRKGLLMVLGVFWTLALFGQNEPPSYPAVNENKLANTKWKYTYTSHTQSNTVIHKAENGYEYYLFLKYDYTLEHNLNGRSYKSYWKLNDDGNELYYNHRQVNWWRIAEFTDKTLVLEFSLNTKSSYRYHFVAVSDAEAPFKRAPNELPNVDVESYSDNNSSSFRPRAREGSKRRKVRRTNRQQRKQEKLEERLAAQEPKEYMKIELVGGGYFGGVDPVYRDYTVIETDGRVIREVQTEQKGLLKTKANVSREALEDLITFIQSKSFFDYDLYYQCSSSDCNRRLTQDPRPIPLRLAITVGSRRKVVSVSVFGKDDRNVRYVDYPKELDVIVDAIQRLAAQAL